MDSRTVDYTGTVGSLLYTAAGQSVASANSAANAWFILTRHTL